MRTVRTWQLRLCGHTGPFVVVFTLLFFFLQPFKNVKTALSSWFVQKRAKAGVAVQHFANPAPERFSPTTGRRVDLSPVSFWKHRVWISPGDLLLLPFGKRVETALLVEAFPWQSKGQS